MKAEVQRVTEENARLVRNLEAKVEELNLKLAEEKKRTEKLKEEIEKKESTSKDVSRKSLEAEIQDFKANWKQNWDPAITAKELAEHTEAVLKVFEPIEAQVAQSVTEEINQEQY